MFSSRASTKMNIPEPETSPPDEPQLRDLFSFEAGGQTFAVFAEEVEGTADSKHVAALPHSPPGVLGVLCVRGRMLTALDPVALLTGERLAWPAEVSDRLAVLRQRYDPHQVFPYVAGSSRPTATS